MKVEYVDIVGYITFGPKDNYLSMVPISYMPTNEQIENLKKFFGFDVVVAKPEEGHE